MFFHLTPFKLPIKKSTTKHITFVLFVDEIPITRQPGKKFRKPPVKPFIPIPAELPELPQDVEIPDFAFDEDYLTAAPGPPQFGGVDILPKVLVDVFPDFPDKAKKRGVAGEIVLRLLIEKSGYVNKVELVKNGTGNKDCADAAIQAAYKTRYIPAQRENQKVAVWIIRTYQFK